VWTSGRHLQLIWQEWVEMCLGTSNSSFHTLTSHSDQMCFLQHRFKARPCPQLLHACCRNWGIRHYPLYLQAHSAHHPLKPRSPRGSSGSVAVNRANNLCDAFGPTLVLPPTYFRSATRFSFSLWLLQVSTTLNIFLTQTAKVHLTKAIEGQGTCGQVTKCFFQDGA
jgi:hypothetical protein